MEKLISRQKNVEMTQQESCLREHRLDSINFFLVLISDHNSRPLDVIVLKYNETSFKRKAQVAEKRILPYQKSLKLM